MVNEKYDILFVDDDPSVLRTAEILLKQKAKKLVLADSGEKCLEILANDRQIDLVLLDIMMPGIEGTKILEAIRSNPLTHQLKVIMQTGMMNINEEQIKRLNAKLLLKPYSKIQLIQIIDESMSCV